MNENGVKWYGLDPNVYDNSNEIDDIEVGDKVIVFDLSSYVGPQPELPIEGIVVNKYETEIDVKIEGWDRLWEIYTVQFGFKLKIWKQ